VKKKKKMGLDRGRSISVIGIVGLMLSVGTTSEAWLDYKPRVRQWVSNGVLS